MNMIDGFLIGGLLVILMTRFSAAQVNLTDYDIRNISQTLDELLDNYDKRLRPGFGGPPTEVGIWMSIRSMGPVSEIDMMYNMDAYLRQTWLDTRLQFTGKLETLQLNVAMLKEIWKPDTYIMNGMGSYLHTVTGPNILFRLTQNGSILYSMRLTIRARCPMHLQKFPMDNQKCPMRLASYGYNCRELKYHWQRGNEGSITYTHGLKLSQFDLMDTPAGNETIVVQKQIHSSLFVHFGLERHMGYFLIQVYVPCSLLVVLSWVAFWINREATADRIALGITTVLTMAFLRIDNRTNLPKVSYSTALDWYLATCFAFVLATILQFSGVHYFTKHGSGEVNMMIFDTYDAPEDQDLVHDNHTDHTNTYNERRSSRPHPRANGNPRTIFATFYDKDSLIELKDDFCIHFLNCLKGSAKYRDMKQRTSRRGINSVSKIDRVARILFPVSFLGFNLLYWTLYLHIL